MPQRYPMYDITWPSRISGLLNVTKTAIQRSYRRDHYTTMDIYRLGCHDEDMKYVTKTKISPVQGYISPFPLSINILLPNKMLIFSQLIVMKMIISYQNKSNLIANTCSCISKLIDAEKLNPTRQTLINDWNVH